MKIYVVITQDNEVQTFDTIRDAAHFAGIPEGTIRNKFLKGDTYKARQVATIVRTYLNQSEGRKRKGNAENFTKNTY